MNKISAENQLGGSPRNHVARRVRRPQTTHRVCTVQPSRLVLSLDDALLPQDPMDQSDGGRAFADRRRHAFHAS